MDCKDRDFTNPNDPECPSLGPCKNGGTCWNKTCCCLDGYEGVLCHIETMECNSSPCVNGGTCKDEIGSYRCECIAGKYCFERTGRNIVLLILNPMFSSRICYDQCEASRKNFFPDIRFHENGSHLGFYATYQGNI